MKFVHAKDHSQTFAFRTAKTYLCIITAAASINNEMRFPIKVELLDFCRIYDCRVIYYKSESAVWLGGH